MTVIGVVCGKKRLRMKLPPNLKIDTTQFTKPDPTAIPLRLRCKYIEGDFKDKTSSARWCAKPVFKGTSWCKDHYQRVYEKKE